MHRVILADNQPIFRAGAARVIAEDGNFQIVAQCDDPVRLPRLLEQHNGCVLVLAHSLGADLATVAEAARPTNSRILLITERQGELVPATRGCQGVLPRGTTSEEFMDAVRRIARGEPLRPGKLVPMSTADTVATRVRERLTRRELQVVGYIAQGHKNKEIAAALGTKEQVIKNYLRSIFDKAGVSDRLELALFVLHHQSLAEAAMQAVQVTQLRRA